MGEGFKDKKASLIVMGIFELLGGLLCVLLAAVMLLSMVIAPSELSVPQLLMGMAVYVVLAVWLIGMAIGTIRSRRWARLLMLAVSWLMLGCGIMAMGMMVFLLPKAFASLDMPDETVKITLIFSYASMAMIYLLFPSIGILFYGNRNVRATIEHADLGPSWTERCPLPVLALVIMLAMAASSILMMSVFNFAMPFFGTVVSGGQGAIVLLGCSAICITLAFGVHKLRPAAWWGVLVMLCLGVVSQWITYSRIDLMDFYKAMGYSEPMLQQMRQMVWMDGSTYRVMAIGYAVPGLIYLLLLKRYFKKPNQGEGDDRRNNPA